MEKLNIEDNFDSIDVDERIASLPIAKSKVDKSDF
jgi:hypothetical protein